MKITDLRRINVFIGPPSGKSNIIEALSLFSIPHLKENKSHKFSHLIRLENGVELFYNGAVKQEAIIRTNVGSCRVKFHPKEGLKVVIEFSGDVYNALFDENLTKKGNKNPQDYESLVKRYQFKNNSGHQRSHPYYLAPPFGDNLMSVIENHIELKHWVISLLGDHQLKFASVEDSMRIKPIDCAMDLPYSSLSNALQRLIFYKTAIATSNTSILLFDNMENQIFPTYLLQLTQQMIYQKSNQYFLATHSPIIINDLLENARNELSVYLVSYKDKQTEVSHLNSSQLHEIYQYGIDIAYSRSYISSR